MGTFSTGVGLVSGIDFDSYIQQVMAIESIPIQQLQQRSAEIDTRRAAYLDISARILAVQNVVSSFSQNSFFKSFSSTSSNQNVLSASASENAAAGSYSFRVHSLVTTHSVVSRGFADADRTPVGAGTMSIEIGNGRVNPRTRLDSLNGGNGVERGIFTITDRSGASADIDLSTATTVTDVIDAINLASDINVRASVTSLGAGGDRLVIEDLTATGDVTQSLRVSDVGGGLTAADLGIVGESSTGRIDGTDLVYMTESTQLDILNDGNGVGRVGYGTNADMNFDLGSYGSFDVSLGDVITNDTKLAKLNNGHGVRLGTIRITNRAGQSAEVDLSGAVTAYDVRQAIAGAGIGVSATMVNSHFQISDSTTPPEGTETENLFKIEDVTGNAAADLGILTETDGAAIFGKDIYRVSTIGDVIRAINYAPDNNSLVEASISEDGNGITLRPLGFLTEPIVVTSLNDSTAARDLGIEGASFDGEFRSRDLLAGLNSVLLQSLDGGQGIDAGSVSFTDSSGQSATLDFSGLQTLQQVIDQINSDANTSSIEARINASGNGIDLLDKSGGNGQVVIGDISGTLAEQFGIAGTHTQSSLGHGGVVHGDNLQLQYVSRQTELSELNGGRGISDGRIKITDGNGGITQVSISSGMGTVGRLIDSINSTAQDRDGDGTKDIEAIINSTGDGIEIVDHTGGQFKLKIEDTSGGRAAADLRIAGEAGEGENSIDGSYEIRIDVSASDTLNDLAQKIEEAGAGLSSAVINDQSAANPYMLSITSSASGLAGEMIIDAGGLDLGLSTLSRAQDALVSVGGASGGDSMLVSSSTNTLDGVIEGLSIDLLSTSSEPVTVSVAQDVEGIAESIADFVARYNDVQDAISEYTVFNPETEEKGALLGESTVSTIRTRMHGLITKNYSAANSSYSRLFSVGISVGANNHIEFDADKFKRAYAENPEEVESLFNAEETGFAATLTSTLEGITAEFDGLITKRDDLLSNQQELLDNRVEDLNVLLEAKKARLEARFVALEQAIAAMQDQQSSLSSLSNMFQQ